MARIDTPSSVMYNMLKRYGMSNHAVASSLLNTTLSFDGKLLQDRIDESSQLSRRVVHTRPGDMPIGLFNDFLITCPQLMRKAVDARAVSKHSGNVEAAIAELDSLINDEATEKMIAALETCNVDSSAYRNMTSFIRHAELASERNRTLLAFMLFVITGCVGDPKVAALLVVQYATDVLGADFQTAQTIVSVATMPKPAKADVRIGLVRIINGHIVAGSRMHMLDPNGTEIGLLPRSRHVVTDVAEDVSRRHARIWRENGRWYITGLGSTNGTRVVSGTTGQMTIVELPRAERSDEDEPPVVEIAPTDILHLGETTQFIVMAVLGS